jgi:aryl-alcohol dehydrogenase-like predicted oxidoreductase
MKRRNFLTGSLLAIFLGRARRSNLVNAMMKSSAGKPLPKRRYKDDIELSVIGFGGIVLMGLPQRDANDVVAKTVERGVNYFDVAPSYGRGEAEQKLGQALAPCRKNVFLACKTMERDAAGSQEELLRSLKRLRTDHFDLYQFHAVTKSEDVEQIFAVGGAMETVLRAREEGKIKYIGFSAHSESAALAMMDRFPFDSILFPFNMVCYEQGNFGPAVMEAAKQKGVARLALKMLARGPWPDGAKRTYPKAWYEPILDAETARAAVRFTLSEDVTAAIPPGDLDLFNLALTLASDFQPLSPEERAEILAGTRSLRPLFHS